MAYTTNRYRLDCVIVAISNYFGKPYYEVVEMLKHDSYGGYFPEEWVPVVKTLLGRNVISHQITSSTCGIVRLEFTNGNGGHVVACIDGHIFEGDGKIYTWEAYKMVAPWFRLDFVLS